MHALPRLLGMALFLVLAVLAALLAAPAWRPVGGGSAALPPAAGSPATTPAAPSPSPSATATASAPAPRSARIMTVLPRLTFGLAIAGVVLAAALLFSLALRPPRHPGETRGPFPAATAMRTEVGALAKLAESSVAQGAELTRERDVRRRAEQDGQLKQQLLAQALEERARLGRDLHDGIIQSLYAVGLTLEAVRALVKTDPAEADRRLEQTRLALNNTIREVRAYITGLAPDSLRRDTFAQALESLLGELGAGRDVSFDLKVDDDAAALFSPAQTIEALQVAREAVSNSLRHGGASLVTLRVHKGDREVCLLVQDNGTGFDPATKREGGHGLGNMRARAAQTGGSLRLTSQPGQGARVVLTFPVHQPDVV